MQVVWTDPAKDDLRSIFSYYKKEVSTRKATEIIDKILSTTDVFFVKNVITEEIGQTELDLINRNRGYRYLLEGHYKIIYFLDRDYIVITHAFDTRQDPRKKLR